VELADRRDVCFPVRAVQPFGDVEDDVGVRITQTRGKVGVGLEADHRSRTRERGGDGIDRGGIVPLREAVVGAETWGLVFPFRGILGWLLVEREADAQILHATPMKKRVSLSGRNAVVRSCS